MEQECSGTKLFRHENAVKDETAIFDLLDEQGRHPVLHEYWVFRRAPLSCWNQDPIQWRQAARLRTTRRSAPRQPDHPTFPFLPAFPFITTIFTQNDKLPGGCPG